LIVHISSTEMLHRLLPKDFQIPPIYSLLIDTFWPGALSLLFPSCPSIIPPIVTANHTTMAVRMPSNTVARALIALADVPLAAPSANSSGSPSPTKAKHVYRDLNGKIPYILDGGACSIGLESTVVDGLSQSRTLNILRPGGVTVEDIKSCLQHSHPEHQHVKVRVHHRDYQDTLLEQAPTTPGMKYRHYSPRTPVILLMTSSPPNSARRETFEEVVESLVSTSKLKNISPLKIGLLLPEDSKHMHPFQTPSVTWEMYSLGMLQNTSIMASRLFDGLLDLEERVVDFILAESIEETQVGLAFMNRLSKASTEVRWMKRDH